MYVVFDRVFSRFGTLVEIFTNQDMEFCMEFYELCEKMFIDNQIASWDHHKAKGEAWIVQILHVINGSSIRLRLLIVMVISHRILV
jgi:hypothetical protein